MLTSITPLSLLLQEKSYFWKGDLANILDFADFPSFLRFYVFSRLATREAICIKSLLY